VETNVAGFTRMTTMAFDYFKIQNHGHLAIISSIAGTKGIGVAPSYSATKRYQNTYMEALEQLARSKNYDIKFTDIRPGFVNTELLAQRNYPMLMEVTKTAKQIYAAIEKNKRVAIIDKRYYCLTLFWKLIPKWIWVRIPL
ncbi:MAG: SDR family NAD(P)-dependent oxidoreductase, partial [Bacteroidales bacterium]